MTAVPVVGVLALQGDVREHVAALADCGVTARPVRRPRELDEVDALVIPGGESTTIDKLMRAFDLRDPVLERLQEGMPAFGSCAGMILLANSLVDASAGQQTLGGLDITVRRNAFGRQVDSFEEDLHVTGIDGPPVRAVFIRAPWVEEVGEDVEVLATVEAGPAAGRIVAVRQRNLLATSFHPEITGDHRVHRVFVDMVRSAFAERSAQAPVRRVDAVHVPTLRRPGGSEDVRPLQVGHHEAQEGGRRRQARQDVRQADQEHRGGGTHGRW